MSASSLSAPAAPPFIAPALRPDASHRPGRRASSRSSTPTWLSRVARELWQVRQTWRTLRTMQTLQAQQAEQSAAATAPSPEPAAAAGAGTAAASRRRGAKPSPRPTLALQGVNFLVFQTAWFAAVLGAAQHSPLWGTGTVLAAIGWHLAAAARPAREARLVAAAVAIGFCVETAVAWQGHVAYPSGQPIELLAPYWMVALWGLLAITLNVTMRWLKGRHALAALLGAIAGPASFYSGVQLGGARFVDTLPALLTLAGSWAVLLPVLMLLSTRFDGVGSGGRGGRLAGEVGEVSGDTDDTNDTNDPDDAREPTRV